MSLTDSKKNITTTIASYNALKDDLRKSQKTNSLSSINASKDVLSYMLSILESLVGAAALQNLVGELFISFLGNQKQTFKDQLKKQVIQSNADSVLPFDQFNIPMKSIDTNGILKNSPTSQAGALLYGRNTDNFNYNLKKAVSSPNTPCTYGDVTLTYNSAGDYVNIKANKPNSTISEFLTSYINKCEIYDEKALTSELINSIFGGLNLSQNKTDDEIFNDMELEMYLSNQLNEAESNDLITVQYQYLQDRIPYLKKDQTYIDIGCGIMVASTKINDVENLVNSVLSGNTASDIGQMFSTFYTDTLINGSVDEFGSCCNEEAINNINKNKQNINSHLHKSLIEKIQTLLLKKLTGSCEMRTLQAMMNKLNNGDIGITDNVVNDLGTLKNYVNCLSFSVKNELYKFIFDIVKSELNELVKVITNAIIQEKIAQFKSLMRSLFKYLSQKII